MVLQSRCHRVGAASPVHPGRRKIFFRAGSGERSQVYAEREVTYDDRNLYFAFRCLESDMAALRAVITERGGPLYLDDDVELFFLPPQQGTPLQFVITTPGDYIQLVEVIDKFKAEADKIGSVAGAGVDWRKIATLAAEILEGKSKDLLVMSYFGLAQLHQLRGRVGRGSGRSRCILLTDGRLSEEGEKRLKVMEATTDGFRIAEADLEIRGPGDFLGTRQAGIPDFRVANILRDGRILEEARIEAFGIVEKDPELALPEHGRLRQELVRRWGGRLELAGIA